MLTLEQLNALPPLDAAEQLRACCGSARWVEALVAARPFESLEAAVAASDHIWWTSGQEDWNEALACHPRIGEAAPQDRGSDTARGWSAKEQEAVAASEESLRRQLAVAILEYERTFGWIYVVCASGRGALELLADVQSRLPNNPERERMVTAREQLAITERRLRKMIST